MRNERYAVAWCAVSRRYYRLTLSGNTVTEVAAAWLPDGRDYWAVSPPVPAGCPIPDLQLKPPPVVDAPPPLANPPVLHTAAPLRACMGCGSRRIGGCECLRTALPCIAAHRYQCLYCRNMKLVYLAED